MTIQLKFILFIPSFLASPATWSHFQWASLWFGLSIAILSYRIIALTSPNLGIYTSKKNQNHDRFFPFLVGILLDHLDQWPPACRHQGLVLWKTIFPQMGSGVAGKASGWFKCITLIVHFISIIITSAPPQIIRF